MTARVRVGVLISGRGSNLQALVDACAEKDFPAEIACVVSNFAEAEGLRRAEQAQIPSRVLNHRSYASRENFDGAVSAVLEEFGVKIVCLAGFMRVLSNQFVETWRGRLINIHPSLLPAFKGVDVHRRVLDAAVSVSGCSVHFVVPELDSGPLIAQATVPVLPHDDEAALAARVLAAEHKVYPLALRLLAENHVRLDGDRAIFDAGFESENCQFGPALR